MTPKNSYPARGEIWLANLDPIKGREQAGVRPCLVFSVDRFNQSPFGLVVSIPITSTKRGWQTHAEVKPPDGGLKTISYIKCEDLRSMSTERLIKRLGSVSIQTMTAIESRVRVILGL